MCNTERHRETERDRRHTEAQRQRNTHAHRTETESPIAIHMSAQYVPTDVADAEVLEDDVAGVVHMHRCRVQDGRPESWPANQYTYDITTRNS